MMRYSILVYSFMNILNSFGLFAACVSAQSSSSLPLSLTLIADFVTVDYLWGSSHNRSLYEESGQFVVSNNVITGIKVSSAGDIFVSVPRWKSGVPSSLNKLVANPNGPGYVLKPWPSWDFNAIGVTGSLQYAQSFIIDSNNVMWIPEVGRTNFYDTNPLLLTSAPAGIFKVNVSNGEVISRYHFPEYVVSPNNSFVNDIVLDEINGYAYFTNTWAEGGIIVYNINKNISHAFSGPCTMNNASYNFCVNSKCYGTNALGSNPSDGIALNALGTSLYWSPVGGQGLYSISTVYLWNFTMTNIQFQQRAIFLGYKTGCSDGLLYLNNNLYYGNIQTSTVGSIDNIDTYSSNPNSISYASSSVFPSSPYTLNWIDTFAVDFNNPNAFYFTSNRLNLFFSSVMDFTGQSGPNFRIYHAVVIDGTSTSTNSVSGSSNSFSTASIIAIASSCFIFALFVVVFLLRKYCWISKTSSTRSGTSIGAGINIQLIVQQRPAEQMT